jgi:hypothetical protein
MKTLKSRGPRTDSCGTPENISKDNEIIITTIQIRILMEEIQLNYLLFMC